MDVYPGQLDRVRQVMNLLRETVIGLDTDNAVLHGEKYMAECRIAELEKDKCELQQSVQNLCAFIDTTLKSLGYTYVIGDQVAQTIIDVNRLNETKVELEKGVVATENSEGEFDYLNYPYVRATSGF